jgi:hypothetical protein
MTPETKTAAIEALRFEVLSLEPAKETAYWKLMDLFDQGDSELSHALEEELKRLAKAKEIRFKKSKDGAEAIVVRLAVKKAKKKPTKAPAKPKKKSVKKKKK